MTNPKEKIIANIETTLNDKPDEMQQNGAHILRTCKSSTPNIEKKEWDALRYLSSNDNLIILPADNGNATVFMNTTDYIKNLSDKLQDAYHKLSSRDQTTYPEVTTKSKIKSFKLGEKKSIPREISSRYPKLYELLKMHKPDTPLRSIVSAVNSPTRRLEKFISISCNQELKGIQLNDDILENRLKALLWVPLYLL